MKNLGNVTAVISRPHVCMKCFGQHLQTVQHFTVSCSYGEIKVPFYGFEFKFTSVSTPDVTLHLQTQTHHLWVTCFRLYITLCITGDSCKAEGEI